MPGIVRPRPVLGFINGGSVGILDNSMFNVSCCFASEACEGPPRGPSTELGQKDKTETAQCEL